MNNPPKIVLPEGNDDRVRIAARILMEKQVAHPVLIGDVAEINEALGESADYTALPLDDTEWQRLKEEFDNKPNRKPGEKFDMDPSLPFGASLVRDGLADGIVAGALSPTPNVIRAYIKVIGMQEGVSRATSCFLMEKGEKRFLFGDCGVNPVPTPEMRAETAYLCSRFAPLVGIDPRIALLSFSTKGSAKHERVSDILETLRIARERWPELVIDGELQVDSAIVPAIAKSKAPESSIEGDATVLIFPDLDSGNIAYKIAERFGGYKATGPLLLGFKNPAHDLSRGCDADDIVSAVEVAVLQCNADN